MADSPYQAAWAYLQGCIETLAPLVPDLAPAKVQERLQRATMQGRLMVAAGPNEELVDESEDRHEPPIEPVSTSSGGVYFPHDLESAGRGTFTAPAATEEEIEELMNRRYPDNGTESA